MTTTQDTETDTTSRNACCCSSRKLIRGGAILAVFLVTAYMTMPHWLGYVLGGDIESTAIGDGSKIDVTTVSNTDETRLQFVGVWKMTTSNSRRTMTLDEDGTGLLIYEPTSFIHRSALGKRVEVDIEWSKSGDYVEFISLRGRPAGAFKTASRWEGKNKKRRIKSVDDEKMVLINETNKKNRPETTWHRVKD